MIFQIDPSLVRARTLYIVATPLGHARDITLRALDVLANVSRIAAEDTRVTVDLLRTHALPHRPIFSVREHNEHEGAAGVIAALAAGDSVAYVSDAGTPGVSDPGARLVADVRAAGYAVVPVPGASAITALISVAGFAKTEFIFAGFLPHKTKERNDVIAAFAHEPRAIIFYEATHRLADALNELATHCGERTLVIGKELTKTFETIVSMPAHDAPTWLAADAQRVRGEFVLALASKIAPQLDKKSGKSAQIAPQVLDQSRRWAIALAKELPPARAAKVVAQMTGVPRETVYGWLSGEPAC